MNPMKVITILFSVFIAFIGAEAQTLKDSADIYIKQSPGDSTGLPENRIKFDERAVLSQNNIRSISLYYPEQDEWVTISSNEDFQWGTSELISDSESGDVRVAIEDSINDNYTETSTNRLAELLGNMISNRSNSADGTDSGSDTRVSADDETMNAFREAFEAVLQEENDDSAIEEDDRVKLPVLYGNVDGIVLDETRSKTGRDFYNAFYESWSKAGWCGKLCCTRSGKAGPGIRQHRFC